MKIEDNIRLALEEIDEAKKNSERWEQSGDKQDLGVALANALRAIEQLTQAVDALNSRMGR